MVQELLGNILKSQEHKKFTAAIFLDLSKAFDSLEHHVLLRNLEIYGIHGKALDWFKSYLSNQTMRGKCQNKDRLMTLSDYHDVEYSVPQGSCLGPLVFSILQ